MRRRPRFFASMDHEEQTNDIQFSPGDTTRALVSGSKPWLEHPLLIPLSILAAGGMIALAIFIGNKGAATTAQADRAVAGALENSLSDAAKKVRPVDERDHLLGNPDASVTIIEFSDFQCPYCESFHPILKQILAEYDGKVRWVYRHFPLSQIHPEALGAGVASECIAELAGNEAFWTFVDGVFAEQRQIGSALYERLAQKAGINLAQFRPCADQSKSTPASERVARDLDDALNAGGNGTPYVVVLNAKGEAFPFAGALPYEQVKRVVEQALASNDQ